MAKGACRPCDLLIVAVLLAGVFETATAARLIHDELSVQSTRADSARGLRSQAADPLDAVLSDYLSNAQLVAHLDDYTKRCGNISRVLKIGESVDGVPLLALEISDQPGKEEAEPNLKLIAGIHGNEPLGRVVTVALAEWLCANYHTNSTAARIVRDAHLWILPAMNPDGFALGTRENANQADLNRNFPDHYSTPPFTTKGLTFQPETQAVMSWVTSRHFVSSISYHGGALVANYPWDATPDGSVRYDASPDDKTFKYLATTYAKAHPGMVGPENSEFPTGITNGAAWYPVYGGMQDWNYVVAKCMELTLEIGVDKWPPASTLPKAFADNKEAVLKYLDATAFGGLSGRVLAQTGTGSKVAPLGGATIAVKGISWTVTSGNTFGDYYRPLAPGTYTVQVRKTGYTTAQSTVTVPASGAGVVRDFVLKPSSVSSAGR